MNIYHVCVDIEELHTEPSPKHDFKHSVLRVQEIYALESMMFYIAVNGLYKP